MKKILMASLAVLVLVIGMGSHALSHSAEAKGMPKCWLNADGTVKTFYLQVLKSTPSTTKFPIPALKRICNN